jgi:hypothetical protein
VRQGELEEPGTLILNAEGDSMVELLGVNPNFNDTLLNIVFIPHYRTGNSPADSQGIGHLYSKLSFMRRAEL